MGRIQFSIGFAMAFYLHCRFIEDVDGSLERQKHLIGLIEKAKKGEIAIREDSVQPRLLGNILKDAYATNFSREILNIIRPKNH